MGCFSGFKRVTVHFSRKIKNVNSSVIWPQIKKCHKMKYTFHPHFCSKFQGPTQFWPKLTDLDSCWLFLAWCGYFGYFWSKRYGILKFGTKVGVKSIFHLMTFFDSRPNNRSGRVLAFFGLIWLSRLFLVRIEWDLKNWNKSGSEKYISFYDIFWLEAWYVHQGAVGAKDQSF